jgi:hypothetical protein
MAVARGKLEGGRTTPENDESKGIGFMTNPDLERSGHAILADIEKIQSGNTFRTGKDPRLPPEKQKFFVGDRVSLVKTGSFAKVLAVVGTERQPRYMILFEANPDGPREVVQEALVKADGWFLGILRG